jgi:hypothetical protein
MLSHSVKARKDPKTSRAAREWFVQFMGNAPKLRM